MRNPDESIQICFIQKTVEGYPIKIILLAITTKRHGEIELMDEEKSR